jgi:hypothetical protein
MINTRPSALAAQYTESARLLTTLYALKGIRRAGIDLTGAE